MSDNPWIIRFRPKGQPALRLFCFPHAGAGSAIFRDWHAGIAPHVDVCAIEPPGRLARRNEPSPDSVASFVEAFDQTVGSLLDLPFVVFGYSLGAMMAFEWLRALRRRGVSARQLIVAASVAPQLKRRLPPISRQSEPEFVRELERRYGPLDAALKQEQALFDIIVKIMRTDMGVLESYQYYEEKPLSCPILAIAGTEDPSLLRPELEGWSAQTTGRFQAAWMPGGHFFLKTCGLELRRLVDEQVRSVGDAASGGQARP